MQLVIVESPTKARKLSEYLGSEYAIEASVGHVRDLPRKKLGIDLENNFEPTYEVDPDKMKVITRLKQLAAKATTIYLATDPDREGEAIAWHIKEILESGKAKSPEGRFVRATFHEITKPAVLDAISHPGEIAFNLVNAQQARRVVDRLVGYQVSPVLWRKVRRGLSAGRVQSVALRLIVEREREIEAFNPEEYWEVDVLLSVDTATAKVASEAEKVALPQIKPEWLDIAPAQTLVARLVEVDGKKYDPSTSAMVLPRISPLYNAEYSVQSVDKKKRERSSLPPFTTSTLQQAAANRLGFTSKQTMALAQQLYEEGLITYHRTDSFNLSATALTMARDFIGQQYGTEYVPPSPRYFNQKSKNAQEAHEAVRVTDVMISPESIPGRSGKFGDRHVKLYDLIWRRFLASQMASAVYDQTSVLIKAVATQPEAQTFLLRTAGSVLTFDGWMRLFNSSEDTILPSVEPGQDLALNDLYAAQKFTLPPPRYNDASLVKELEKRGIGRPSTYASIVSVIVDRGYVERQEKKFTATTIGMVVNDFLCQHFPVFMEYDFTAEMEENLDRIARGEKEWREVVKTFYGPLAETIASVSKDADRVQIPVEETGLSCPKCGETEQGRIVIRAGKFGKFKSCNRFPECDFTENIVEKLEGMNCPLCGEGDVIVKNSRWGKSFFGCSRYPQCDWASWQKPAIDLKVSAAEWKVMQEARAARKAAKAAAGTKTSPAAATKKPAKKSRAKKSSKTKKTARKTATTTAT